MCGRGMKHIRELQQQVEPQGNLPAVRECGAGAGSGRYASAELTPEATEGRITLTG
jgi:hypothetical protein